MKISTQETITRLLVYVGKCKQQLTQEQNTHKIAFLKRDLAKTARKIESLK